MSNKDRISLLQTELGQINDWIKTLDRKASFIAVGYSAAITFFISEKQIFEILFLSESFFFKTIAISLLFGVVYFGCTGIFNILKCFFPETSKKSKKKSLLFFRDIGEMKQKLFCANRLKLSFKDWEHEILNQIYENSVIAKKKSELIQNSTASLLVLLILLVFFVLVFKSVA